MNENLSCEELVRIIDSQNTAFLCGNGFSINFDSCFKDIYSHLFEAHKKIQKNGKYDVQTKADYPGKNNTTFENVFKNNFYNVKKYLNGFKTGEINEIFESGIVFAQSIINNDNLVESLIKKGFIIKLEFGRENLDLVIAIARSEKFTNVNIEYWNILIYFYFAIKELSYNEYELPSDNKFITLIEKGDIDKNSFLNVATSQTATERTFCNGFNTYYKILFAATIFSNGKAVDFSLLDKNNLNISKISAFLNKFKCIFTLNYDHILEMLTEKEVNHLHGKYVLNKKEYIYFQSLGLDYECNKYVSFSDILIGDYFINKTFSDIMFSKNHSIINRKYKSVSEILEQKIQEKDIDVIVIFGMNIDNDQHIIRNITCELIKPNRNKTRIIYCYFDEQKDKALFREQYASCNYSNKTTNEEVNKIEVSYIKTMDILKKFFY